MKQIIYLDNSATTRPYDEVTGHMADVAANTYGNPSSMHTLGIEAERLVKASRDTLAKCLEADPREIYFTSGGTESNNMAIRGYLEGNPRRGKHIITTAIEHPSVLEVFKALEKQGYKVDFLGVDQEGRIRPEELGSKITAETALISLILVNNETGAIQPLEEIAALRDRINKDTAIHLDAVQAFGKLRLSPSRAGVELMSVSSHKIHGPKGVGALYAARSVRLKPLLYGGGQEALMRSGTENVPGISGFGLAADMTFKRLDENGGKVLELKRKFIRGLEESGLEHMLVTPGNSSPYILNAAFADVKAEVLLHHLEERKIFVSTGSACSSRKNVRSHVLSAMGVAPGLIDGAVRFSFSAFNTGDEVETAVRELADIVPRIRIKRSRSLGGVK